MSLTRRNRESRDREEDWVPGRVQFRVSFSEEDEKEEAIEKIRDRLEDMDIEKAIHISISQEEREE